MGIVTNSPLSQLETPSVSPLNSNYFIHPELTPNSEKSTNTTPETEDMEHSNFTFKGERNGRAQTVNTLEVDSFPNTNEVKGHYITKATTPKYHIINTQNNNNQQNKLNVNKKKKRSYSQADHHLIKFLAPN